MRNIRIAKIRFFWNICKLTLFDLYAQKKEKPLRISLSYFFFEDRNYTRLSLILAFLPVSARK